MTNPDYIEALHAAARRERSEYVHCLIARTWRWLLAMLPTAPASLRTEPCC